MINTAEAVLKKKFWKAELKGGTIKPSILEFT